MTDTDGRGLTRALGEMKTATSDFRAEIAEASRALRGMDDNSRSLARSLGSSLRSAFDKAVFGGAKLGEVFRGLASDVLGKSLELALKPVQSAVTSGLGSLFGSLTGALTGALPFAAGGAFAGGRVRAFADGGVIGGPTWFPMRGGLGLMGEAGPEAIMPLRRGPDGRLGVQAQGGGAAQVVVNISTPDVAGFQRSRGQIAAQLARIVQHGANRV